MDRGVWEVKGVAGRRDGKVVVRRGVASNSSYPSGGAPLESTSSFPSLTFIIVLVVVGRG